MVVGIDSQLVFPLDIDECQAENGNCQQMCRNTEGSYQCLCYKGFQLHVDQRQCVGKKAAHKQVQGPVISM